MHVNGFGGTPLMELYLLFECGRKLLNDKNIKVARSIVGNFTRKYDVYCLGIIFFEIFGCFNTNLERFLEIKKLKNGEYSEKYPLFTKMISKEISARPSLEEVKKYIPLYALLPMRTFCWL